MALPVVPHEAALQAETAGLLTAAARRDIAERATEAHTRYLDLIARLLGVLALAALVLLAVRHFGGSVQIAIPEWWRLP